MRGSPINELPPSVRQAGRPAGGHLPPPAQVRAGEESRSPAAAASTSRYAKPKLLMGEVAAPKGEMIAASRAAFRAFMLTRHLRPSEWAARAGVPVAEILSFLTGKSRSLSPGVADKLAAAAGVTPDKLFG